MLQTIESFLKLIAGLALVLVALYFASIGFKETRKAFKSERFLKTEQLCAYEHNTKNFETLNGDVFCIKSDGSYHFIGYGKQSILEKLTE